MLNISQIEKFYPQNLSAFKKNILREYLQYKILEIIFNSKFANQLSFLGGTMLRMVYNNQRFSEDLDFDNFNLSQKDFKELTQIIKKELELQGFQVEIRNVIADAFHCYIKLPKVLFDNDLSDLVEEKILIRIDTAPHNFNYSLDKKILNKFDVFTEIKTTPIDIILAQKIYAVFNRQRVKGRDFFDIIFLLQKTKPNYKYLKEKINIDNSKDLKDKLIQYLEKVDFNKVAKDVEPFLFNSSDVKKIKLFLNYIKQVEL